MSLFLGELEVREGGGEGVVLQQAGASGAQT